MSLTKVSYSMIDGAAINVIDYGADPTGVSDSTAAIQAAVDFFAIPQFGSTITSANAGGTIFFPRGVYKVNNVVITVPTGVTSNGYMNGIKLIGDNAVLKGVAGGTNIISISTNNVSKNIGNIELENLQFDLSNMTVPGFNGSIGLFIANAAFCSFKNLSFIGGPTDNTHIFISGTASNLNFYDIDCSRVVINGQDYGPAQLVITTTNFYRLNCTGVRIDSAWQIGFFGCVIQDPYHANNSSRGAFYLTNCRHITVVGCDAEGTPGGSPTRCLYDCSNAGVYGVNYLYSVNNSWASLGKYILGEAYQSTFQDKFSIGAYGAVASTSSSQRSIVQTTPIEIYNFIGDPTDGGVVQTWAKLTVFGSDGSNAFVDEISVAFGGVITVLSSNTAFGSPAARTYSFSVDTLNLALASGNMTVKVLAATTPWIA